MRPTEEPPPTHPNGYRVCVQLHTAAASLWSMAEQPLRWQPPSARPLLEVRSPLPYPHVTTPLPEALLLQSHGGLQKSRSYARQKRVQRTEKPTEGWC